MRLFFFRFTDGDEVEFFSMERGCMIELRAQKLVESKLNPFAVNFTRHALRAIRSCTNGHTLLANLSTRHHQCIMEIYYTLLLKSEKFSSLQSELAALDIQLAKQFIKNTYATLQEMSKTPPKSSDTSKKSDKKRSWLDRLRKPYIYMSSFVLRFTLKRILNEDPPQESNDHILKELLDIWIIEHEGAADFESLFSDLVQTKSQSSARIYDCCEYFHQKVGISMFMLKDRTFYC